jgi:hypothetical protein
MTHILFHVVFHLALLSWELHPLIEQGANLTFKVWWFQLFS